MKINIFLEHYLNKRMPPWKGKWTWEDPFHNRIHCMVLPYLKGFDIIKWWFSIWFHISCVVIVFRYLWIYCDVLYSGIWFLKSGIIALSLGIHCGQIFFIFADFFFGEKKNDRDILEVFGIFLWKICRKGLYIWVPLRKKTQVKKKSAETEFGK